MYLDSPRTVCGLRIHNVCLRLKRSRTNTPRCGHRAIRCGSCGGGRRPGSKANELGVTTMPHPDHAVAAWRRFWYPSRSNLAVLLAGERERPRRRLLPFLPAHLAPLAGGSAPQVGALSWWRGEGVPPSATRQIPLLRPGRCLCQAIPAVKRRPAPPHPDIKELESRRDDSAACLELNSSACAGGRARPPDPEPSPVPTLRRWI